MPARIQALFVTPSIAFARLGSSTIPVDCYKWVDVEEPRYDGETTLAPDWSLTVEPDASIRPFRPDTVVFRDGERIRPVAPFFEVWARLGEDGSDPATWTEVPLTPALMQAQGLSPTALTLRVSAFNRKAARRTGNPALAFGTFTPVVVTADDHKKTPIAATSPPGTPVPMIPPDRSIALGSVQWMRSVPQPTDRAWSQAVNVEVMRFRYWPAPGAFYGPPQAAAAAPTQGRPTPAVRPENAFLDANAGWFNVGADLSRSTVPFDTYDVVDQAESLGPSLGVVDDTCEVHFSVRLATDAVRSVDARAVAFVGPPDFAPDRRPFLSVADELNDRCGDSATRNAAMDEGQLDRWVEDLFERIYETVSLFNVDLYRAIGARASRAAELPQDEDHLRDEDIDDRQRPLPDYAMGGRDRLRDPYRKIPAATPPNPLPLSEHARARHRNLSDLQNLEDLVARASGRIREIVREPFQVERFENARVTSMRMPPFMRQSNALPLTIAAWQHDLLMRWVDKTEAKRASGPVMTGLVLASGAPRTLSASAASRRDAVLARLDAAGRMP